MSENAVRPLEIVHFPHPALRWKSKPLTEITAEVKDVVRQMFELMYEAKGIGLAANQVALPWRLFVINLTGDPSAQEEELVFINPEITHRKGSQEGEEGCLSLPKLYGQVRRAVEIVVDAFDLDGQGFELTIDDLGARAVQHETDHLDGGMFTDRMTESGQREVASVLSDFEMHFRRQQQLGKYPSDEQIREELRRLEPK
ncbi:MAG TPA: peptide deformylase [Planctomycetaceae bacterium]|nr:peptide deformylase [Planctomycetaceae bacterium]